MAQFGLPIANRDTTNWTEGAGDADGDWFDELDEGFGAGRGSGSGPDDATSYWQSPNNPSLETIRATLNTLTDPNNDPDTGTVRWRSRKSASGGRQIDFRGDFFEGAVTQGFAEETNINDVWTTRTDPGPFGNITDFTDLNIQTQMDAVGGGPGRRGYESAHELEIPDAAVGPAAGLRTLSLTGAGI